MNDRKALVVLGVLLFGGLVVAGVLFVAWDDLGCRPDPCVEKRKMNFRNETSELLFPVLWSVQSPQRDFADVPPSESVEVEFVLPFAWGDSRYNDDDDPIMVFVYDWQGCLALNTSTSVRKLRDDHDWTFVIRSGEILPPTNREDCDITRLPRALRQ